MLMFNALGWLQGDVSPLTAAGSRQHLLMRLEKFLGLKRQNRFFYAEWKLVWAGWGGGGRCLFVFVMDFLLKLYVIPKQYPHSETLWGLTVPEWFIKETQKSRPPPPHHHLGWDTLEIYNLWMPLYSWPISFHHYRYWMVVTRCKVVLSNKNLGKSISLLYHSDVLYAL